MSPHHFYRTRRALLTCLAAAALPFGAAAQDFPNKTVTIVVPFSAGGTTDILARIVGHALAAELGQPVVIDNRAGAGGNIGAALVAKAAPDGYTLLMGTVGTHAINEALYKKMPFNPGKDFAPLSRVATVPTLLVTHPSQPYKTVQDVIDHAKAKPGEINYGSSGNGTSIHLSAELFKSMTGTEMQHIPYKGSGPAIADLLGNQFALMFDNMPSAIQHVRSGKLRPIAVTTATRSPELPDIPTIAESGVPGFEAFSWFGLFAPANTPGPVITKLHTAIAKVLTLGDVKEKIAGQGGTVVIDTPEQFTAFMQAEAAKWGKVVKASGATVD